MDFRPQGSTAIEDWQNSLSRQLELYEWVQTPEGALGGGVTNSWKNNYEVPPADVQVSMYCVLHHIKFIILNPGLHFSRPLL